METTQSTTAEEKVQVPLSELFWTDFAFKQFPSGSEYRKKIAEGIQTFVDLEFDAVLRDGFGEDLAKVLLEAEKLDKDNFEEFYKNNKEQLAAIGKRKEESNNIRSEHAIKRLKDSVNSVFPVVYAMALEALENLYPNESREYLKGYCRASVTGEIVSLCGINKPYVQKRIYRIMENVKYLQMAMSIKEVLDEAEEESFKEEPQEKQQPEQSQTADEQNMAGELAGNGGEISEESEIAQRPGPYSEGETRTGPCAGHASIDPDAAE